MCVDRKEPKNYFFVKTPLWGIRKKIDNLTESSINKQNQLCEFTDLPSISEEYFSFQTSDGWNTDLKALIEGLSLKTLTLRDKGKFFTND